MLNKTYLPTVKRQVRSIARLLVVAMGLFLLSISGYFGFNTVKNTVGTEVKRLLESRIGLDRLLSIMQDAETGQRGYLLTGKKEYLDPYLSANIRMDSMRSRVGRQTATVGVYINQARLDSLLGEKLAELAETIRLYDSGKQEASLALVNTEQGKELMDSIRNEIAVLNQKVSEAILEKEGTLRRLDVFLISFGLTTFLIVTYLFFSLYRTVQPILQQINSTTLELKAQQEILQEKNNQLEYFAYISSHDLNEPLRTVKSFIEIIEEEYFTQPDEELASYFEYINSALTRMRGMIDGLLSYSRIGKSGDFQLIDTNHLVDELLKDLGKLIQNRQAVVSKAQLPTIYCLPLEIKQLFQNLIANAVKFQPPETAPQIRIDWQETATFWEFTVADNGIGIDERMQGKIFNIFAKLHLTTQYEGSGIGLAFCKKIVELHNGRIWVNSAPGKGSTFHFTVSKKLTNEKEAK